MFKTRFFSILALLLMAVSGAWADETPLVTINSTGYTTFTSGSKTFDDKVTVTFSNSVSNDGDHWGWYADDTASLLTVAGINGYTITSCKFYTFDGTAKTGYTVAGESPSVYLNNDYVYTDDSKSENLGKFGISKIEVYGGAAPAPADVTGVTLSQTSADMTLGGETLTLTATVAPDDATDKTVTWTTSDASVATVADGVVTAVGAGIATITATATNGTADTSDDVSATCAVTVSPAGYSVSLKSGTEDATSWQGKAGEGEYQALPLTGLEAGTAVSVKYSGTKKVKSVKAKKKAAVPVTAITLNKTETSIEVGSTETLSVTAVAPDNATDKTYTWKTSDASKATVDQDGKVTAVAAGTVTIYAEANDGSGVKGNCTVTVTPVPITVTWHNDDITGSGNSFTKDGVTINAGSIDFDEKSFEENGTFTTTLGNFTKIEVEVTNGFCDVSGTGWSGDSDKRTWTGNASSVSFIGDIYGDGNGIKFVFTIEP